MVAMKRSVLLFGFLCFLLAGPPVAAQARVSYQMIFRGYSVDTLRGVEEYIVEFPLYAGHRLVGEGPEGSEYEYESGAETQGIIVGLRRMFMYLDIKGGIDVEAGRITVTHPSYVEQAISTPEPPPVPEPKETAALQAPASPDPKPAPAPVVAPPPVEEPAVVVLPQAPLPKRLVLRLTTARGDRPSFAIGENFDLTVELSRDAWLYCYYRQADGRVVKFFPNPQRKDARLKGGTSHGIPGDIYPFDLPFAEPPGNEQLTCYATDRDVDAELPALLRAPDFAPLPPAMVARLQEIFDGLPDTVVARASLPISVKR